MRNVINIYFIDNITQKIIDLNGVNVSLSICLYTNDIKNLYYKTKLEDYLVQNYIKKLELDQNELKKNIN